MICEIISIGTELLTGNTVNTNTAYIAKVMMEHGLDLYHQSVVGDNPIRLKESLERALMRSDIVITTGGLGPTYDDLTKETVCELLGKTLVENKEISKILIDLYAKFGAEMTGGDLKQAYMPIDAIIIPNEKGTAPGLIVTGENDKKVIMLPGPPRELIPMMDGFIKDYLSQLTKRVIVCRNLNTYNYGESALFNYIKDFAEKSVNPSIATYVADFDVIIRITASAEDKTSANKLLDTAEQKIRSLLPKEAIYGVDAIGMEYVIVEKLREKGLKISIVESCTGGLLSKRITDVPGSSQVFEYGICTYSNESKRKMLGTSTPNDRLDSALDEHGAVSPQTATAMAEGMLALSNADIAIAITGIAGPDGGTAEKPVGLVYIALAKKDDVKVYKHIFSGTISHTRNEVRTRTTSRALSYLLNLI